MSHEEFRPKMYESPGLLSLSSKLRRVEVERSTGKLGDRERVSRI